MFELFNKSPENKFKNFYKHDEFIESFNYDTNYLKEYKEDFEKIFTIFNSMKIDLGVGAIINSEGVFSNIFLSELSKYIQKSVYEDFIYEDGISLKVIDEGLQISVYLFIFQNELINNKLFYEEDLGQFGIFSNTKELYNIIEKYDYALLKGLYEKFNLKYNQIDKKYYKVIYIGNKKKEEYLDDTQVIKTKYFTGDSQGYIKNFGDIFLKGLQNNNIIKNYSLTVNGNIEDKIDGYIELNDLFRIDLGSFSWEIEKNIWFIGTDKIDKRVIDFLNSVYKYQFDQTIEIAKNKINYVLNFSTDKKNNFGQINKHINRIITEDTNWVDRISMKSGIETIIEKQSDNYMLIWDENTKGLVELLVYGKYYGNKNTPKVDEYIVKYDDYMKSKGLKVVYLDKNGNVITQ